MSKQSNQRYRKEMRSLDTPDLSVRKEKPDMTAFPSGEATKKAGVSGKVSNSVKSGESY